MDIHNNQGRLKKLWVRIDKYCSKADVKILARFQDELYAHGLSTARIIIYLGPLYMVSKNARKGLAKLDKDDLKKIISKIEMKDYSEWTKVRYKYAIKKFYSWLDGIEWNTKEYSERVKWIGATVKRSRLGRPVILTKEEILKLFSVCKGTREKALCSFMYESGCRCPDELLHMKVGDVEFDDYGAKVKLTSGKVGTRVIRIVSCVPHLKAWINEEHLEPKSNNWLWVSKGTRRYGEPIGYGMLKNIIRKWKDDAGITKRVTAYTFRRTRYTHLSNKWPTPVLYKYMGQVQGSKVIDRYVELNEDAVDDAVLNFYGMKQKTNGDIKPLFCSRCNKQNSPELEYCDVCHAPLTEKAMVAVDEKKRIEMQDVFNEMVRKFKEEMREETI